MKNILILLPLLLFTQCEIKERVEELALLEKQMKEEFKNDNIDFSMKWGEESYLVISFHQFKYNDRSWTALESLASQVKDFAL